MMQYQYSLTREPPPRQQLDTMKWQEVLGEGRPNKRYGHSAVVYRGSMYIFGGYDDFGLKCNDLWQLDFGTSVLPVDMTSSACCECLSHQWLG
jgi:hypothetical protein